MEQMTDGIMGNLHKLLFWADDQPETITFDTPPRPQQGEHCRPQHHDASAGQRMTMTDEDNKTGDKTKSLRTCMDIDDLCGTKLWKISASRNNGGGKKMRQLVALGTMMSWATGIQRSHRDAGKVALECVEALLMCQEATRGANDESCSRMRVGMPCTVDAWGVVVNKTQSGSVRVQNDSLKEGSR